MNAVRLLYPCKEIRLYCRLEPRLAYRALESRLKVNGRWAEVILQYSELGFT
jgi:hypothetical protein